MIHLDLQGKSNQDQCSDHKAFDKYCREARQMGPLLKEKSGQRKWWMSAAVRSPAESRRQSCVPGGLEKKEVLSNEPAVKGKMESAAGENQQQVRMSCP